MKNRKEPQVFRVLVHLLLDSLLLLAFVIENWEPNGNTSKVMT